MVNMTNYEEYMLLYADGELSKEDEQALLTFVEQHPELQAELKAYAATRLQPDTTLVYEDKEALIKSGTSGRTIWLGNWKTYAAAASIILVVVLFALNRTGDKQIEQPIVIEETITEPVTNPAQQEPIVEEHTLPVKEVHSTKPVGTVAVETKQKQHKTAPVVHEPVVEEQAKKPIEQIAKAEPIKTIRNKEPETVIAVKTQTESQPVIVPPAPVEDIITEAPVKKKNNFIASVLGKKPAILDELGEVVNEKVIIAKNVRDQIKDTDVKFKIGNKELFTVRL